MLRGWEINLICHNLKLACTNFTLISHLRGAIQLIILSLAYTMKHFIYFLIILAILIKITDSELSITLIDNVSGVS